MTAFAAAARAQTTNFDPSLTLGGGFVDNVDYVGAEEASDTVSIVGLELPVEREGPRGTLRFSYAPSYHKYSDDESLDHDEHRVALDWNRSLSQKSTLQFVTDYTLTQLQGDARLADSPDAQAADLTLTERTDREHFGATLHYSHNPSARWRFGLSGRWGETRSDDIENFEAGDTSTLTDRTEYAGGFEFGRTLQRGGSFGLSYEHLQNDAEGTSSDEQSNMLGLAYEHEVNRRTSLTVLVGGSHTTGDVAGGAPGEDERTEFRGDLGLRRSYSNASLQINATYGPGWGSYTAGSSTDASIGAQLSSAGSKQWLWSGSSRYVRRDPVLDGEPTLDTIAVGASVERVFERYLGLRVIANYTDQAGGGPDREGSVLGGFVGLVWYPMGRSPIDRGATR